MDGDSVSNTAAIFQLCAAILFIIIVCNFIIYFNYNLVNAIPILFIIVIELALKCTINCTTIKSVVTLHQLSQSFCDRVVRITNFQSVNLTKFNDELIDVFDEKQTLQIGQELFVNQLTALATRHSKISE